MHFNIFDLAQNRRLSQKTSFLRKSKLEGKKFLQKKSVLKGGSGGSVLKGGVTVYSPGIGFPPPGSRARRKTFDLIPSAFDRSRKTSAFPKVALPVTPPGS